MKARHNAIYFPVTLLVIVFCLFAGKAEARGVDSMHISGRVALVSARFPQADTVRSRAYYGLFKNEKSAKKSFKALKTAIMQEDCYGNFDECCKAYGFKFTTLYDGSFSCTAFPGMVIAAFTDLYDLSLLTDESVVKEGKTDYTVVINSTFIEKTTVCLHCLRNGLPNVGMGVVGQCTLPYDSIPEDESSNSGHFFMNRPFKFLDFTAGIPEMELNDRFYTPVKDDLASDSQVVQYYFAHKKEFIEGKQRFFGNKYFKLYRAIPDSLELDTVTMIAYNYWVKPKRDNLRELYTHPMAPYILNRMARMLLKAGIPDTTLLMPFIDEPATDTVFDKGTDRLRMMEESRKVYINMSEILVTQAMNYLVLGKYDRADKYREWMVARSRRSRGALYALRMYMDFVSYFLYRGCLPEDHPGVGFVLNSSLLNKAALMTEMGFDFEETNDAIDMLDDNDPRKWYLKGMLWAGKADKEEPDLCAYRFPELNGFIPLSEEDENILAMTSHAAFEKYSKEKDAFLEKHGRLHRDDYKGIRHYLAYFHHSFKLGGPMFRKCYLTEGRVYEEKRKENKYLKKDFAAYEELFKLLKARDDENRARLLGEEVIDYEKYMVSDGKAMRITGGINVVSAISNGRDTIDCNVSYGLFKDMAEAEKAKKQLDSLQYKTMTSEDFRIACRFLGFNRKTTQSGRFVTLAEPGMVILPVTADGETVAVITDENVVRKGKTDYMMTIKSFSINGAKSTGRGNRYIY